MNISRLPLVAAALTATLALSACGSTGADDGKVEVLASFYPLEYVAAQVGGDRVTVSGLTPAGGDPHSLELAPAAVRSIGAADVVVVQSGFTEAVDQAVAASSPAHLVDAAPYATLGGEVHEEDGAEEAEHEEEEAEHEDEAAGHEGHDHSGADPHFWLSPGRLVPLASDVADALTAADPDGAAEYAANAQALVDQLRALEESYSSGLQTCAADVLVTTHEAFGYVTDDFGLTQVGILGLDPEVEASPARLREIGAVVAENDVSTVFVEAGASAKMTEVLASDLDVATSTLNPLETLTKEEREAGQDYASIMTTNLDNLRTALDCG
ncbi:zinc transport system substrate-binding protein [Flavimobilis marinus]|uniref:Zinc transport system substrate-binding protein n=1 Tax=Flavimobilis marinus TaxID=285351 RepID=A0A1I2FXW1_9MICO|nr:zinc ABC transporter substrate-binding protein [Flavimobilis marinus]SFF09251.1 zinc transport system substrate-binding protein [Flavimobilis marinus]